MTSHRIGVNLRVSGNCDQGARKYMEDNHVIKFLKKDTEDYEFAYFGIFDGHGGPEASAFCKDNLLNEITKYEGFWTDDDDQVLAAVRKGFLDTHHAMWNVLDTWPKTVSGLPSTAGSTATIAIIKQGKLYTGHVGDSALVLGENNAFSENECQFQAVCITKEHKPDDPDERLRIEDAGGEVINKSGVPRVVWSRPKISHKGPVRRSTQIDQIPFLAVARSLGDLWSYDYYTETYVVSPDPDVTVMKIDPGKHRCLILASDGLWNMLTPEEAVNVVMDLESQFEQKIISDPNVAVSFWSNPAERLVSRALNKWRAKALKADNTSCVVVLIDPLGPSKLTLLRQKRQALLSGGEITTPLTKVPKLSTDADHPNKPINKNTNCSLNDSHIRTSGDSILQLLSEKEHVPALGQPFTASSRSKFRSPNKEYHNDCIDESFQDNSKLPVKWNLRHSLEDRMSGNSSNIKIHNCVKKISAHPSSSESPTKCLNRMSQVVFTKLVDAKKVTCEETVNKHKTQITEQMTQLNHYRLDENIHGFMNDMEEIDVEENEKDSDFEKWLLTCPPEVKEQNVSKSDAENSLHSSANVTDQAFSLASDESLESPSSSFGNDNRPPSPQSAPARLSSMRARMGNASKLSRRKLIKNERKLFKLCSDADSNFVDSSLFKLSNRSVRLSNLAAKTKNLGRIDAQDNEIMKLVNDVEVEAATLAKGMQVKPKTCPSHLMSPPKRLCMQKVLNTSKSMNDVVTPKNPKEAVRSVSCTGLTPSMNLLMSEIPRSGLNNIVGTCTRSDGIKSQLLSSLTAADSRVISTPRFKQQTPVVSENGSLPYESISLTQAEPLKQHNKTGPIRKVGTKHWGSFLRASKQGIDQMFHHGSHHRGTGKFITTSTGKLECGSSEVINSKNTSMSASRLPDLTITNHLHDTTLFADFTVNTSSITTGDLTNLSALTKQNSTEINVAHCSMLDADLPGKIHKRRKGFFQKTGVALRRASRAAKKAFFPENHRLFHKSVGNKRRSSEFSPTPEVKRRKQQAAE